MYENRETWGKICISDSKYRCAYKEVHTRFLGSIEAKIDAKGRVFLPVTFRKVLQAASEESLILRKDVFQSCLTLYPGSVWNAQLDTLGRHPSRWNTREQLIFRQFVSDVELLLLNANGRLLTPKHYLKMANIEQAMKSIGMDDTIEMWCNDVTEKPSMQPEEFGRALQEIMSKGAEPTEETE